MAKNEPKKSKREQYLHDRGQRDAAQGKRPDPPHKVGGAISSVFDGDFERRRKDNNAYWNGRNNHNKQTGKRDIDAGSWCFITTATLSAIGKPDNCDELNLFRGFRDNWLILQPDGRELIEEYYLTAPKIVAAVNSHPAHGEIYRDLWASKIKPCYDLIQAGEFGKAKEIYCLTVIELKERFIP